MINGKEMTKHSKSLKKQKTLTICSNVKFKFTSNLFLSIVCSLPIDILATGYHWDLKQLFLKKNGKLSTERKFELKCKYSC